MKKLFKISSILLMSIILVETIGFSRISSCEGNTKMLLTLFDYEMFSSLKTCHDLTHSTISDKSKCLHASVNSHPSAFTMQDSNVNDFSITDHNICVGNHICIDANYIQLETQSSESGNHFDIQFIYAWIVKIFSSFHQSIIQIIQFKDCIKTQVLSGRYLLTIIEVFRI